MSQRHRNPTAKHLAGTGDRERRPGHATLVTVHKHYLHESDEKNKRKSGVLIFFFLGWYFLPYPKNHSEIKTEMVDGVIQQERELIRSQHRKYWTF